MSGPTSIEKENLEAHVELCAQRYESLDLRLTNIEQKVSTLQVIIEEGQLNTIKVLVGTAGTIIVGVLSLIGIILTRMPH